jgi:hypothetical protein
MIVRMHMCKHNAQANHAAFVEKHAQRSETARRYGSHGEAEIIDSLEAFPTTRLQW